MNICTTPFMGVSGVFNEGFPGALDGRSFQEVPGYFCVFREWTGSVRIRLKFEVSESSGTIYLSGKHDGVDVFHLNGSTWEQREAIAFSGTADVTSESYFDAPGFKLTKPVTTGRVSAYTVTDAGVETLVGAYLPRDTAPKFRRYRVACMADASGQQPLYRAVARIGFQTLVNTYDEVLPANVAAIRLGLSALLKEDAEDYARAEALWELAKKRLVAQSEAESEGVQDHVEVADDFDFEQVGRGL